MILTRLEKTDALFEQIWKMNELVFTLDERAPKEKLRAHFLEDDIFVMAGGSVGFAFVTQRGGPYLMIMAIAPAYQKCGNGRLLLKEVIAHYPSEGISLTCKTDNVAAQILYLKSGFRPIRVIPKYYGAIDGLLMRRETV